MLKLKVNDIDIEVEEGLTVLQACEKGMQEPTTSYLEMRFEHPREYL